MLCRRGGAEGPHPPLRATFSLIAVVRGMWHNGDRDGTKGVAVMLNPDDVFQPKAFPKLTYIGRSVDEDSTYEEELQEALDIPVEWQITESRQNSIHAKASGKGKVQAIVAAGEASGEIGGSHTTGDSVQRKVLRSNAALIRYIIEQEKVIVLEQMYGHYYTPATI